MVKKISLAVLIFLLIMAPIVAKPVFLEDRADILSDETIDRVSKQLDQIYEKYGIPVYVYTNDEWLGSFDVMEIADDILRERVGVDETGILFLIDIYNREVYINTSGVAIDIINDYRQEKVLDAAFLYMPDGNYDRAVEHAVKTIGKFVDLGKVEGNKRIEARGLNAKDFAYSGIAGIATYIITFFGIKSKNKSKRGNFIYSLIDNSSTNLTGDDVYVNTTTRSYAISKAKNYSSTSSSSRTTSTTHKSSGGGTFSGRGRKF